MTDAVTQQIPQLQWTTDDEAPEDRLTRSQPDVHEVYRDAQLDVVSDENVSRAQAQALADRVEKAYAWDETQLKWSDPTPLAAPLTVAVLSRSGFSAVTGDTSGAVGGVTTGPNLFVVPDTELKAKASKESADVLAHELTHVQDFREAGRAATQVPTYLVEGRAYVDGDRYAKDTARIRPVLEQLSGDDAEQVMKHFRSPSAEQDPRFGFIGEVTGALFVEFLRTRLNGKGEADAMKRLSQATEDAGKGTAFSKAFEKELGVSLPEAEKQFVQYVSDTEGDPHARLSGTAYA